MSDDRTKATSGKHDATSVAQRAREAAERRNAAAHQAAEEFHFAASRALGMSPSQRGVNRRVSETIGEIEQRYSEARSGSRVSVERVARWVAAWNERRVRWDRVLPMFELATDGADWQVRDLGRLPDVGVARDLIARHVEGWAANASVDGDGDGGSVWLDSRSLHAWIAANIGIGRQQATQDLKRLCDSGVLVKRAKRDECGRVIGYEYASAAAAAAASDDGGSE